MSQGEKITVSNGVLQVPNNPIIPFIEGDGIGPDIWAAAVRVLDAAVEQAYKGEKKIEWKEVLAGEKPSSKLVNGFHRKHWTLSMNTSSLSKGRLLLLSEAESVH